jgi:hypothetical protein
VIWFLPRVLRGNSLTTLKEALKPAGRDGRYRDMRMVANALLILTCLTMILLALDKFDKLPF